MVVTEAFKKVIWVHGLIEDLEIVQKNKEVFCDSESAICLAKNQVHHSSTKHTDVRFHFIREIVEEGDVLLQKISMQITLRICSPKWLQGSSSNIAWT